ncbi:LysR family transcriptional regulator, partial [Pseudomonas savastanoi pv. glycinea str. race 4]
FAAQIGPMMLAGITKLAPTGVMLMFAILYFALMIDSGLFDPAVRKILTQIEMSTHFLRSYGGETEVLRVSTPSTFGARWLVPRLKGWRLRHPHIHLDLINEQESDDLIKGRCDVSFYFGQAAIPGA